MKLRLFNSILSLIVLLYPVVVYFGTQFMMPRIVAAVLLAVLLVRFWIFPEGRQLNRALLGIGIVYFVFAVWQNSELSLRFYPVLVNGSLLLIFAISLVYPPTAIERLARLQHPNLSPQGVKYTRRVTQVWSVFFLINGLIAAGTAVWASFFWWSLYNGCIAYVLIGLLMGIEYLFRVRMQAHDQ